MIEKSFGQNLRRGFRVFEGNNTLPVGFFEGLIHWISGIDAESMVKLFEKRACREFDRFEIANHPVFIELIGFKNDFDPATVPVREAAGVGVACQHVAVFNFESFADAVWHGSSAASVSEEMNMETVAKTKSAVEAERGNGPLPCLEGGAVCSFGHK